jgi:hypothetical protein
MVGVMVGGRRPHDIIKRAAHHTQLRRRAGADSGAPTALEEMNYGWGCAAMV